MKDVAETLVEEADALGEDLEFDVNGERVRRPTPPKPGQEEPAAEQGIGLSR
jgi:hypothetical protein